MTIWGHIVLGIEILIGLWLVNRNVSRHITKITLEFNGKSKKEENGQSQ